ncbi:MAG TPA: LysR family transcriptional regulator [Solirubrobacteraceae bacterium]|nr:LysR family transcriptional regulator [Solirubrobacteraceae bacterium]
MIDVRRLRALRELADRGTIAAAANALQLTPSAVSQQLAALEREVGHRLLEPEGRGVRLTPAAHVLLEHAGSLFAGLERMRADLDAHAAGEAGEVRIGAFPTAIVDLVAPAAARLREDAPRVRLAVTEYEAPGVFDVLAAGRIDVALGMESAYAPRRDDTRFTRVPLQADVLDAAVPDDHPLAREREIDLRALADETWVVPPPGWQCESVLLGACQAAGFTPAMAHRTSDWSAALALVAVELGVTLVPRLAQTAPPPGVAIVPLTGAEPPARHLFAACRGGAETAPALRLVLDALQAAAARPRGREVLHAA